jgi:hypothetical protein
MCQQDHQCKFVTWTDQTCDMKTAVPYVCRYIDTEDTVSMVKDCQLRPQTPSTTTTAEAEAEAKNNTEDQDANNSAPKYWIWIVIGVVAGLLVISMIICGRKLRQRYQSILAEQKRLDDLPVAMLPLELRQNRSSTNRCQSNDYD